MRSRQYPDEMGSISGHAAVAARQPPDAKPWRGVELDLELEPIGLDFPGPHAEGLTQKMQPNENGALYRTPSCPALRHGCPVRFL
jgi:hypothetical protein